MPMLKRKRKRTQRAVDPLVTALLAELDRQGGMSITALSLAAGLGKGTVPAWVQGKRVPNVGNMRAALGVVGVTLVAVRDGGR